eukprot:285694-Amphidinium_carterae.2
MQDVHEIPDSRVYNIDETSTRILPLGEYGWAMNNTEAQSVSDSCLQTTRTVAITLDASEHAAL